MLTPLYGHVRGDSIVLLLLAHDTDLVSEVAAKAQRAAAVRVAPREALHVVFRGAVLDPTLTVAAVGLSALDLVEIIPGEEP